VNRAWQNLLSIWIYNYNARLERFSMQRKLFLFSKTHWATRGVVTIVCRIGSRGQWSDGLRFWPKMKRFLHNNIRNVGFQKDRQNLRQKRSNSLKILIIALAPGPQKSWNASEVRFFVHLWMFATHAWIATGCSMLWNKIWFLPGWSDWAN
jgi:hypothetical protein